MRLCIFACILLSAAILYSGGGVLGNCRYETGDQIEEVVEVAVEYDNKDNQFKYRYTIKNLEGAKQEMWELSLILEPPYYSTLIGEEKIILTDIADITTLHRDCNGEKLKYSPDEIEWFKKFMKNNEKFYLHFIDPRVPIKPGKTQNVEFVTTNKGLPSIVEYYAEGEQMVVCSPYADVEFIPGYHDLTPHGPGKVGYTIGPGLFSENVYEQMKELKGEINKAYRLGWIKDKETLNTILRQIDEFKSSYKRWIGIKERADEIIKGLSNMKEAGNIKSEFYQMIKAHLQYISSKR